jgi:uncharacterized protein YfaA (DUF2138 family)
LLLLQALLTALAANGGSRDVHSAIEAALPVLLERLADNNARLRDSARDALVALAQVGVCICTQGKQQRIWVCSSSSMDGGWQRMQGMLAMWVPGGRSVSMMTATAPCESIG